MELKMQMTQTLKLSQRMLQSTEILQMSSLELEGYLKDLAVDNPVIDIDEKNDRQSDNLQNEELQRKLEWLASSDEQNRVYYSEEYGSDDDDKQDMWNVTDNRGEDLEEFLTSQLVTTDLSESEKEIVRFMIGLLDARGYYSEDFESVKNAYNISEEEAERYLSVIQMMDPMGVGARNLGECLILQMDRQKMEEPLAHEICEKYLELLAKNQLPQIAKKLGVSVDEVLEARNVITSLNPKPGNSFSSRENMKYITPDVTVVKLKGYFEILLNEYMYPRMSINSFYRNMITGNTDKETRDYVGGKIRQAEWVMQCVSQRNSTLMSVSREIVDAQEKFFTNGPGNMKPLKLADIAAKVGIHESTVSRAVKDKYLQCAWGVFPMNYFFTAAVGSSYAGEASTADEVKTLLREIIENENHEKPYSDRILGEKLAEKGVKISRRTVAKYREAMGIKDASGRKNY